MGEACNLLSEKLTFRRHCHGISDSLSCHRCAGTFSDLGLDTSAACGRRLHLMRTFGERCGLNVKDSRSGWRRELTNFVSYAHLDSFFRGKNNVIVVELRPL